MRSLDNMTAPESLKTLYMEGTLNINAEVEECVSRVVRPKLTRSRPSSRMIDFEKHPNTLEDQPCIVYGLHTRAARNEEYV